MGLLNNILDIFKFSSKKGNKLNNNYSAYDRLKELGFAPQFTTKSGGVYENVVARRAVDTIATHVSKLNIKHVNGKKKIDGDINYILNNKPNTYMNRTDFIYRIISTLLVENLSMVYIEKEDGKIKAFHPINGKNYEAFRDDNSELWIKFQQFDGKNYFLPYEEIIVLRKFYYGNILKSNNDVIGELLETQEITNQGIKNGIQLSNSVKGILTINGIFNKTDKEGYKKEFLDSIMNIQTNDTRGGIAIIDSRSEFKNVDLKPIILDKEQMNKVEENIYSYFGINEKIINSDFTEVQWTAFYKSIIEPLSIMLSTEFTNKIFSKKAIAEGNQIVFNSNLIHYASIESKVKLMKETASLGIFTKDEIRELINYEPLEDEEEGKKILQTLNIINSKIADDYQLGKNGNKKEKGETEDGEAKEQSGKKKRK